MWPCLQCWSAAMYRVISIFFISVSFVPLVTTFIPWISSILILKFIFQVSTVVFLLIIIGFLSLLYEVVAQVIGMGLVFGEV